RSSRKNRSGHLLRRVDLSGHSPAYSSLLNQGETTGHERTPEALASRMLSGRGISLQAKPQKTNQIPEVAQAPFARTDVTEKELRLAACRGSVERRRLDGLRFVRHCRSFELSQHPCKRGQPAEGLIGHDFHAIDLLRRHRK